MQIFRKAAAITAAEKLDIPHFDGEAKRTSIKSPTQDDLPAGSSLVTFDPGARTHLHTHAGPQILAIIQGECAIANDDEHAVLEEGDMVVFAPGEPHWHGATETGPMAHLAVTFGGTDWLGPVDERA